MIARGVLGLVLLSRVRVCFLALRLVDVVRFFLGFFRFFTGREMRPRLISNRTPVPTVPRGTKRLTRRLSVGVRLLVRLGGVGRGGRFVDCPNVLLTLD